MIDNNQNFLGETPYAPSHSPRPKKKLFVVLFVFLFLAGCFTYGKLTTEAPNDPSRYDPVTLEPKAPDGLLKKLKYFVFANKNVELAGEKDDRINILLLGMGGPGHDGPFLTDTIILASIKPSTSQISMISIPRDLGVQMPGYGTQKINHANAYGESKKPNWGAAFATEVIEKTFDIDIQYYIRIDFTAFKEIINEVGGINIVVDTAFTDPLFPAPNDEYQTISFSAGEQKMDGETALQYARSRHGSNGEGSDFARARRQQKVILALKEKILSFSTLANPVRINNVMKSLDAHMTTNMEFADIMAMVKLGKELDTNNILRLVLDSSPSGYLKNGFSSTGAFILSPASGDFNQINNLIENIFETDLVQKDDTPEQATPAYSPSMVEIQNGTWRAGMAARVEKKLQSAGFDIATIGNTEQRPQESSGIFAITDKAPLDVMQGLMEELHIPIKETPPDGVLATSTTDILILLGNDFNE